MAKKLLVSGGKLIRKTPDPQIKSGYGALYNWYAVDESVAYGGFIEGFTVPTSDQWTELTDHLGGDTGGKLKSVRTDHDIAPSDIAPRWDSPNEGATDEVNFGALPGGYRFPTGGSAYLGRRGRYWSSSVFQTSGVYWGFDSLYSNVDFDSYNKGVGFSVRCVRIASLTTVETALSDGTFLAPVQDYDGNWYEVVKIGTQAWLAQNLRTTHYTDGTPIPNITDNTEWEELTTGAYCWYDNDINTPGIVYTDEEIVGKKSLASS